MTKVDINKSKVYVTLTSQGNHVNKTCKAIVGADGVTSLVAKQTMLYNKNANELILAAQRELTRVNSLNHGFAEVFFGKIYSPGFFAWIIPNGTIEAKVGLCIHTGLKVTPIRQLNLFMNSHPNVAPRLKESIVIGENIHTIPTGGALNQTVNDGVLIVGDAAGQVKSTTGGGIYYSILCAKIAGETLTKGLERSEATVPKEELIGYEKKWRERIGEEISFSCKVRAFLDSLSDNEVDYLFQILREDKSIATLIEAFADIDYQSKIGKSLIMKVAVALAKRPRILSKASRHLLIP